MSNKKRSNSTLHEIQKEIQEEKKKQRRMKQKKWMKWSSVLFTGFFLAGLVFLYTQSQFSKILSVDVTNNHYVSDAEVLSQVDFDLGTPFYSFWSSSLNDKIPDNSIIEEIKVTKHWLNQSMTIEVTEKEMVGYRILADRIELVASDGSTRGLLEGEMNLLFDLMRISGFSEDERLMELVGALSRGDKVLLSNISEIIRNPKTYDENYITVMMADGIELHTSIYSLEKLSASTFRDVFNRLDDNQNCIVYDVFWRSTYAKPCE